MNFWHNCDFISYNYEFIHKIVTLYLTIIKCIPLLGMFWNTVYAGP